MLSWLVWRINCNVSNISVIAAAGLVLSVWLTTRTVHEFQILGEDEQVQDSWNGTEIQQLEVSACKAEVDVLLITGARPSNTNPQTPQDNYTPNVNLPGLEPLQPSHVWLSSASTNSSLYHKPAFIWILFWKLLEREWISVKAYAENHQQHTHDSFKIWQRSNEPMSITQRQE